MQHEMQHKIVKALIFRYFLDILYGFDSRYLLKLKNAVTFRIGVYPPCFTAFFYYPENTWRLALSSNIYRMRRSDLCSRSRFLYPLFCETCCEEVSA